MSFLNKYVVETFIAVALITILGLFTYKVHATPVQVSFANSSPAEEVVSLRVPAVLNEDNTQLWELIAALDVISKNQHIVLYVAGQGGDVEVVLPFVNQLIHNQNKIKIIVDGNVYSGHAYLSLSIKNVEFRGTGILMMHSSSILDLNCRDPHMPKKDRGQDTAKKCDDFKGYSLDLNKKLVDALLLLTKEEKTAIMQGYDVYLTFDELRKRQRGL